MQSGQSYSQKSMSNNSTLGPIPSHSLQGEGRGAHYMLCVVSHTAFRTLLERLACTSQLSEVRPKQQFQQKHIHQMHKHHPVFVVFVRKKSFKDNH